MTHTITDLYNNQEAILEELRESKEELGKTSELQKNLSKKRLDFFLNDRDVLPYRNFLLKDELVEQFGNSLNRGSQIFLSSFNSEKTKSIFEDIAIRLIKEDKAKSIITLGTSIDYNVWSELIFKYSNDNRFIDLSNIGFERSAVPSFILSGDLALVDDNIDFFRNKPYYYSGKVLYCEDDKNLSPSMKEYLKKKEEEFDKVRFKNLYFANHEKALNEELKEIYTRTLKDLGYTQPFGFLFF